MDVPQAKASPRAHYSDAGQAFRALRQRLVAVKDELQPNDLLVALAVAEYLMSWSKVADRVTRDQIAQAAGCHAQTAGRALTRLARLGVLTWTPSTHKGGESQLSMDPPPDTTAVSGQATAPDTTAVSALDTTAVSLPSSSTREEEKPPLPPRDDRQAVEALLAEHWGDRGRRRGQCTSDVVRLLEAGWTWDEVRWLVTSKLSEAKGFAALRWRLGRVCGATPEEARRDGQLAPALNGAQVRDGGRLPTRPGTIEEHGDFSGAVAWASA